MKRASPRFSAPAASCFCVRSPALLAHRGASETKHEAGTTRIVAFDDTEFASNRCLRALYNLDLVLNAVHWVTERETPIMLRVKGGGRELNQLPVPLETSLQALYGVGPVVPEPLLLAAGWAWLRLRSA